MALEAGHWVGRVDQRLLDKYGELAPDVCITGNELWYGSYPGRSDQKCGYGGVHGARGGNGVGWVGCGNVRVGPSCARVDRARWVFLDILEFLQIFYYLIFWDLFLQWAQRFLTAFCPHYLINMISKILF